MKLDAHSAERIGANWLRTALAPQSEFGRRADAGPTHFQPGEEELARARCEQIVALAGGLDNAGVARIRALLRRAPDPHALLARMRAGDPLDDVDFFELGRFVDMLAQIADAWRGAGGDPATQPPVVHEVTRVLAPFRSDGSFTLGVPPEARAAYALADATFERECQRLRATLAPLLGFVPTGDEFIVMRDVLAAVPPGVRVVRETPAYRTLSVALDAAAIEAGLQRDRARAELATHEATTRRELATVLAPQIDALERAMRELGELDRTLARVAFTQRYGGCVPAAATDMLSFEDATYAPLHAALEAEGFAYTPIAVTLRGMTVLTGPNMGGKSAALATCGFVAWCFANGVPPPAKRASLPLFATIAWIGGEIAHDRARLLSAFGGEVVRAREELADRAQPALVLVDEFARTTGPREGRALLVAFIETLQARGTLGLVATHFERVATSAEVGALRIAGLRATPSVERTGDLHAALDAIAHAMDYRVVSAAAADVRSDALEVARLLGLDAALLARAKELYATE